MRAAAAHGFDASASSSLASSEEASDEEALASKPPLHRLQQRPTRLLHLPGHGALPWVGATELLAIQASAGTRSHGAGIRWHPLASAGTRVPQRQQRNTELSLDQVKLFLWVRRRWLWHAEVCVLDVLRGGADFLHTR